MAPRYGTMGRNHCTFRRSCTRCGASAAPAQAHARRNVGARRGAAGHVHVHNSVDPRKMAARAARAAERGCSNPARAEGPSATTLHGAGRGRRGRKRAAHPRRNHRSRYRRGFAAQRFAGQKSEGDSDERAPHGVLARSRVADWRIGQRAAGVPPVIVHRPLSIGGRAIDAGRSTIDDRRSTIDDHWNRGYCPFCGSWPAFIEAHGGAHTLRCSYCALGWSLSSRRCVYCGNAAGDFVAAAPDVDQPQRRVELCGRCSGYTKVIDVQEPTPFPLLAIEDLATMNLDQGAMNRGYRRPELFDLDAIEPLKGV